MVSDCAMLVSKAQLYARLLDWIEGMYRKACLKDLNQRLPESLLNEKT